MNKKLSLSIKTNRLSFHCFIISTFLSISITILDIALLKVFDNITLHQIFDLAGNYFIITPLVYVILQQKKLLEEKEGLLYSSLKNKDFPIFIIDSDGRIIDINPHLKELKIDKKEIIGQPYHNFIKRLHK